MGQPVEQRAGAALRAEHLRSICFDSTTRMLKLAYLVPVVLEKLLIERVPPTVSLKELVLAADLPRVEQTAAVFGRQG